MADREGRRKVEEGDENKTMREDKMVAGAFGRARSYIDTAPDIRRTLPVWLEYENILRDAKEKRLLIERKGTDVDL